MIQSNDTKATGKKGAQSPFGTTESAAREIYLLLQHVAGAFEQELSLVLRPAGITPAQYHVLRVLRAAGAGGLACSAVAERSVSGDPDVTRLLDRLEKHGWVSRAREASDRRVVMARITHQGLRLLDKLDEPVDALHAKQFGALPARELAAVRRMLRAVGGARPA